MKYVWLVALSALAALAPMPGTVAPVRADPGISSPNYSIPTSVLNSGGGIASARRFTLIASVGEPVIGLIGMPPPAGTDRNQINAGHLATFLQIIGSPGDLNFDGQIDILDVKLALQISAGLTNSQGADAYFPHGDVADPSGIIDVLDADKILRFITGTQPTLP